MQEQLKVLIVEDTASDVDLLIYALDRSGLEYTSVIVEKKQDFEDAIRNFHPDLILSDHSLPDFNSLEALEICKKLKYHCAFILVTGTVSEEFAAQCIKEGADDYLLKDNLKRLPSAIENALRKKRAEYEKQVNIDKLAQSEHNYRRLFNHNPMPMWIIDRVTSRFLHVNRAAIKHYGYSREEFLSMQETDLYADLEAEIITTDPDGTTGNLQDGRVYKHQKKDGMEIFVEIKANDIATLGIQGRLILANDITEIVNINHKLEQQNKMLLKLNEELDRFVYSASHELRSPLTSMLGLIPVIKDEENREDQHYLLDVLKTRVERLDMVIKDILNYSRNARVDVSDENIDFDGLIRDCFSNLYYLPHLEHIDIDIQINDDTDFYSDKERVSLLLSNLISNAVKYQKDHVENKPFIRIKVEQKENEAEIIISDNGKGIPEKSIDKIFNMFYRATSENEGNGLGLYIVKETVNKLGGNISVKSELHKGTQFMMVLPNRPTTKTQT